MNREVQSGHCLKCTDHSRGSAHIHLHLGHPRRRFDGDATGIEGYALTDQHHGFIGGLAVLHDDEPRWTSASLGNTDDAPHAKVLDCALIQDCCRKTGSVCGLKGGLGEGFRIEFESRSIGEVTGESGCLAHNLRLLDGIVSDFCKCRTVGGNENLFGS